MSERPKWIWEGVFANFHEAAGVLDAFESERWIESERRKVLAPAKQLTMGSTIPAGAISHDYLLPAIAATLTQRDRPVRILDFGGGLAGDYFSTRSQIGSKAEIEYHVVESTGVCNEASRLFANEPNLHFHSRIPPEMRGIDLAHAGSSLHYVEDWKSLVRQLAALSPKYMIFAELPAGDVERTFVTIQNYYGNRIPIWIWNLAEFIDAVHATGYEVVYRSNYKRVNTNDDLESLMGALPRTLRLTNFVQLAFRKLA